MGQERSPEEGRDVLDWAKQWQPKWPTHITFPQNAVFNGLFEYIHRDTELDVTLIDGKHVLPFRLEHAYDPDGFVYEAQLHDLEASLKIVPFRPDYGRLLRKRHFLNQAKRLVDFAQELTQQLSLDSRGHQIRNLSDVMELLEFSSEVIKITRETLFGNPDPIKYKYLNNPVSFINLENGWIVLPDEDTQLKMNLGVEYEHVFRLSYRFDSKEGPVVEDYHKYETALARLSRQTVRRVFSNLGTYTSIIHNPFFSDISQRFPVRYVALNNGLLVAALGHGSTWDQGTFEFYQPTERREYLFGLLEA